MSNSITEANVNLLKRRRAKIFSLPFLNFWFACFCIGISYLLLLYVGRNEYTLRTMSIGCIALTAFSIHLLVRDAWHDPFHPDILLTVGHLVQFVIPSIIFATGFFDKLLHPHIQSVQSFFPEMLFAVLVAQTVFNIPFYFRRERQRTVVKETKNQWHFFIVLLAVGVWLSRFFILFTGSYFHSGHSEFMHVSTLYSPLAIFSTLGRIVVVYAVIKVFTFRTARKAAFPVFYIVLELIWHLFSGNRSGLLIALLCIILGYIFVKRKVPVRYLLIFLLVLFVGGVFLQLFRISTNKQAKEGDISVKVAIEDAFEKQKQLGIKTQLNKILDRLNDGQFAAGCFKSVPDSVRFLQGKTYKYVFWIPVPRVLYPDRPQFVVNYNNIIRSQVTWSSAPVTAVGEAYLNFGWIAIPVVFFLLGLVYRFMDSIFRSRLSCAEAAVLIFFCTLVIRMPVDPVVSQLSWMIKVVILLLMCRVLAKINLKMFVCRGS